VKRLTLAALLIAAFVLTTAPTAVENHPLTLNGRLLGNMVVIQGGIWAISLEDFARAAGAPITLEPMFQLQGNRLLTRMATPDHKVREAAVNPAAKIQSAQKIKFAPGQIIAVRKAGEISGNIVMVNGKAFIPVRDVVRAFGDGSVRSYSGKLQPGQGVSLNLTAQQNQRGIIAILIGL